MGHDYANLKKEYPSIISSDQLYRICHISKRKAKWLLENGIIPCVDTGKKTRRFKIRIEDVIVYLKTRKANPAAVEPPRGIFTSTPRKVYDAGCSAEDMTTCLSEQWKNEPDALSFERAVYLTGYSPCTISRWIKTGRLTAIWYYSHYLIPKSSLIERLSEKGEGNPRFLSAKQMEWMKHIKK